jgi:C4-dicarboxylate-specific signal transduction histidine kinase
MKAVAPYRNEALLAQGHHPEPTIPEPILEARPTRSQRRDAGIKLDLSATSFAFQEELERLVDERTASLQVAVAEQTEANNRVLAEMSQRKKTEEFLRKAQDDLARISRITIMGELAATIAHEVNQPLSGILTTGNACLRWLASVESSSPNLEEARQAVERMTSDGKRAGDVILRLRNFFKASGGEKTSLQINEVVEGIVMLVRPELERNHILLTLNFSERLPTIQGDSVQLQQVLLNFFNKTFLGGRRGLIAPATELWNEVSYPYFVHPKFRAESIL